MMCIDKYSRIIFSERSCVEYPSYILSEERDNVTRVKGMDLPDTWGGTIDSNLERKRAGSCTRWQLSPKTISKSHDVYQHTPKIHETLFHCKIHETLLHCLWFHIILSRSLLFKDEGNVFSARARTVSHQCSRFFSCIGLSPWDTKLRKSPWSSKDTSVSLSIP